MTCNTCAKIFDLGKFNHCGQQELPLSIPVAGTYTILMSSGSFYYELDITTTENDEKPVIDFSLLPINMEFILQIMNPDTTILPFDIDIQPEPCSEDAVITECYTTFKIKSIFNQNLS